MRADRIINAMLLFCTVGLLIAFGILVYIAFDKPDPQPSPQARITIEQFIIIEDKRSVGTSEIQQISEEVKEVEEIEEVIPEEIERTHHEDVIQNWWEVEGEIPNHPDIPDEVEKWCVIYGKQYNISPELLMAICWKESRFDPTAKNGQYTGLMQVGIRTHKSRISQLGYKTEQMTEIEPNIHVATHYLAELTETYEDIGDCLCAYSGNSGYIGTGKLPNYVQKVLKLAEQYERDNGK